METTTMRTRLNAAIALFMALVLAIGLAPLPQAQALTAANLESQAAGDAVTVALTVVDEMDGNRVVYNGKVAGLTTANTVADLLAAAGFSQVAEYDGDVMTYVEKNSSPYYLGEGLGEWASGSPYWITMLDGTSSKGYPDALLSGNLKDQAHYQYIYTNRLDDSTTWETKFSYTSAIPDPLKTAVPDKLQLLNNLSDRFGKGGKDEAITNDTYGAALALGYLGKGDRVNVEAMESQAAAVTVDGTLAKYALAFDAAGDGDTAKRYMDRVNESPTLSKSTGVYDDLIILPAFDKAGVIPSGNKYSTAGLVAGILAEQAESGLFPKSWSSAQETGEALFALNGYKGVNAAVATALVKARSAAVGTMDSATGNIYYDDAKTSINLDAMGELIDGLVAYDGGVTEDSAKLSDALVADADDSLDGFQRSAAWNETMSAATAFRGLAAAWKADPNRLYLDNAVEVTDIAKATVATIGNKVYTGSAIAPTPAVSYNGKMLKSGTDYTVSYSSNTAVGTANVTLTGKGLFKGAKTAQFKIVPAGVSAASAGAIAGATYSGSAVNPVPALTFGGKALKSGTDFTVSYLNSSKTAVAASNVKAAGTYYARVAGKGNFTGTKDVQFSIAKAAISKTKVKKISKKKYTGKAIKPKPVVKFNGVKLKKGVDYKLSYSKNKKIGTAKVKIKGKGNFKGTKTVKFKIVKK